MHVNFTARRDGSDRAVRLTNAALDSCSSCAAITAAAIPFDSYNTLTIEAWLKDWMGPILCQGMAGDPENSIWMSIGPRRTTKPHETCGWESGKGKNYQFSVGDKLPASWNHLALV